MAHASLDERSAAKFCDELVTVKAHCFHASGCRFCVQFYDRRPPFLMAKVTIVRTARRGLKYGHWVSLPRAAC